MKRSMSGCTGAGEEIEVVTLDNGKMRASFMTWGATWLSAFVPDRKGALADVLLGCPDLGGYLGPHPYFGATVGRYANRIGNASFSLGGKSFAIEPNDGRNCLHGGWSSWARRLWRIESADAESVTFALRSPDGDGGFPGNLDARVRYVLTAKNEITMNFEATVDRDCPVNMTNHAYFNLSGRPGCDILSHELELSCSSYLGVDEHLIPRGAPLSVEGTPFDFRVKKAIGRDIAATGFGYDHCFVVDGKQGEMRRVGVATDPVSGRCMEVRTTQPGVQLYTGNFLKGQAGKNGVTYANNAGFCLETQDFPDAPNRPDFPGTVIRAGGSYAQGASYAFGLA